MKKIKIFFLGMFLSGSAFLFFLTPLNARVTVNNKQIKTETCTDDEGHTTGVGNTCIDSQNFNCLANACK